MKRLLPGGIALAALVGSMLVAQPALAQETANGLANGKTASTTVEMASVPVTAAKAVEYGYEVRTDAAGVQYAVAPGAPVGDFSPNVAVPIVQEPSGGIVTPFMVRYGTCGTSTFTFLSKNKFTTGYTVYTSFGYTITYDWHVTLTSSIDAQSIPYGPWTATQAWNVTQTTIAQALPGTYLSGMAGGTVLTTGGICYPLAPTDKVKW